MSVDSRPEMRRLGARDAREGQGGTLRLPKHAQPLARVKQGLQSVLERAVSPLPGRVKRVSHPHELAATLFASFPLGDSPIASIPHSLRRFFISPFRLPSCPVGYNQPSHLLPLSFGPLIFAPPFGSVQLHSFAELSPSVPSHPATLSSTPDPTVNTRLVQRPAHAQLLFGLPTNCALHFWTPFYPQRRLASPLENTIAPRSSRAAPTAPSSRPSHPPSCSQFQTPIPDTILNLGLTRSIEIYIRLRPRRTPHNPTTTDRP